MPRCALCDVALPGDVPINRLFCSSACRAKAWRLSRRAEAVEAHRQRWLKVRADVLAAAAPWEYR